MSSVSICRFLSTLNAALKTLSQPNDRVFILAEGRLAPLLPSPVGYGLCVTRFRFIILITGLNHCAGLNHCVNKPCISQSNYLQLIGLPLYSSAPFPFPYSDFVGCPFVKKISNVLFFADGVCQIYCFLHLYVISLNHSVLGLFLLLHLPNSSLPFSVGPPWRACVLRNPAHWDSSPGKLPRCSGGLGGRAEWLQLRVVQHRWSTLHHPASEPRVTTEQHPGHGSQPAGLWNWPHTLYPFSAVCGQSLTHTRTHTHLSV